MTSLASAFPMILVKWSALLALGWTAHWLFRKRHPRWRLILWRSILCLGLAVPLMECARIAVLRIPIYEAAPSMAVVPDGLPSVGTGSPVRREQPSVGSPTSAAEQPSVAKGLNPSPPRLAAKQIPWKSLLLAMWGLGAVFAGLRLVRLQVELGRLRKASQSPSATLQAQAREIQAKLEVPRTIGIRVSESVASPFVCSVFRPAILLPLKLIQELPSDEISALLAHEIAHFRRHDLFWCVGWRWMQALFWPHPLVWRIPAAHNLACEQEADRIAAGELRERGFYPQLLARLALRVLALPAVETRLALNGSSQISKRLTYLSQGKAGAWRARNSVAGFGLAFLFFLLAAGCQFSARNPAAASNAAGVQFKKVRVVVQDEDGKPVAGARLDPMFLRVSGTWAADRFRWREDIFGRAEEVATGPDGTAWLKYPVIGFPEENARTKSLEIVVRCPEYLLAGAEQFLVEGSNPPIRLQRGIPLEASGYFGADHQPVTELVGYLNTLPREIFRPEDWQRKENGVIAYWISAGNRMLQLMGRLPSGEIVYSDYVLFTAEKGKPCRFNLEMKPRIRLEGRLDDKVPRPVTNGRVMISVRPKEFPAFLVVGDLFDLGAKYGMGLQFWHSYRPLNEDGTFVFESVPPGEADITVLGDGFVSASIGQIQERRTNGALERVTGMAIPQPFPLVARLTRIEVATEPTATLELTAKTTSGKPIEGVWAGTYASVLRMGGNFGWNKISDEKLFRQLPQLSEPFIGQSDQNGKLVLNLPAEIDLISIGHRHYAVTEQAPWKRDDRRSGYARMTLSPGATNRLDVIMEPL